MIENEAMVLNIAAKALNLRTELTEVAAQIGAKNKVLQEGLRKAELAKDEAEAALYEAIRSHSSEAEMVRKSHDAKVKQQIDELVSQRQKISDLTIERDEALRLAAALEHKVQAERSSHAKAATISIDELARLEKLAGVLTARHTWHISGKQEAHGFPPQIVFECTGCHGKVLAPEDFLQWF